MVTRCCCFPLGASFSCLVQWQLFRRVVEPTALRKNSHQTKRPYLACNSKQQGLYHHLENTTTIQQSYTNNTASQQEDAHYAYGKNITLYSELQKRDSERM